jgi:hypothetical protein
VNPTFKRIARSALRRVGLAPIGSVVPASAGIWDGYTRDAMGLAQWVDCDRASLERPQQHPERLAPRVADRRCNWYLPVFDSPYYGGVMTILRLAAQLKSRDGVAQRFLICGACDTASLGAKIGEAFAPLAGSEVMALDSAAALESIPAADYSVATLWTTAYVLLGVRNAALKFYMIQDYEPLFYPAGSTYAQAELTYRFGFHGIANTIGVRDIFEREYGGRAVVLTPSIDTTVFRPGEPPPATGPRRLFYYARPGTPRNGFELAAAAFRIVKRRMGDGVEIVCAGASWSLADYRLEGVVTTQGMLPYAETGALYRSCHVGLAMMMTKHPSYLPFELMACGTLVVSNRNTANDWFLKHGENCLLSQPTASCLAETLVEALEGYERYEPVRRRAADLIAREHGDWSAALERVIRFMHDPETLS